MANGKTVTGTGFVLAGTDAGNYQLASTTLANTANMTERTLTVTATGHNRVYGATDAATYAKQMRAVTHFDVDRAGCEFALKSIAEIAAGASRHAGTA